MKAALDIEGPQGQSAWTLSYFADVLELDEAKVANLNLSFILVGTVKSQVAGIFGLSTVVLKQRQGEREKILKLKIQPRHKASMASTSRFCSLSGH